MGVAIGRVVGTVSVACMRRIRRAICPCVGCMGSVCPYCGITGVLRQASIVCLPRFVDDVILPREITRVASSSPCSPADSVAVDLSGGQVCLIHRSAGGVSFVGAAEAVVCMRHASGIIHPGVRRLGSIAHAMSAWGLTLRRCRDGVFVLGGCRDGRLALRGSTARVRGIV